MTADLAAIEATGVSLAYRLARNRPPSVKEFAIRRLGARPSYQRLWALRDVTFDVRAGEFFAIIGPNGGGKSTLLKLIARVLPPATGRIVVRGTVAPLIELGAGFNPELTAYENIVLYGTILGGDPRVLRRRAPAIAEWAGVEDFLDVPVRSFSSGMLARLGFAVATAGQPDVLLVDEVLSVGDAAFELRSTERMASLMAAGAAVVLVSHDLAAVTRLAQRVLWLEAGTVRGFGPPAEVIAGYRASVASAAAHGTDDGS